MMGKSNLSSRSPSLPQTRKNMMSKKSRPISKRQTSSENMNRNGKQIPCTDLDQETPIFTEVWPSSTPSSPSDTPTSDQNKQKDSVLARFVDRFRHGQPQSREERQKASDDKEEQMQFWWASSLSDPSGLSREEPCTEHKLPYNNLVHASYRGAIHTTNDPPCKFVESEIMQLQERASRLQKGALDFEEDSLPVSSDGIGCSDFSSPVSADEPMRRPMISSLLQCNMTTKDLPSVIPPLVPPTRPEEDILFQWRLRRKMEKAREWTQARQTFNPHHLNFGNTTRVQQTMHPPDLPQGNEDHRIKEPHSTTSNQPTITGTTPSTSMEAAGSFVSPDQALSRVPSHMHLLCDILPCPKQHSPPRAESVSQRPESQGDTRPQTTADSLTNRTATSKTAAAGSTEKLLSHTKNMEGPKKQPKTREDQTVLSKLPNKSAGWGAHCRRKTSQSQKQKYTEDNKSQAESSSSPIHSALGQVVSEVLFPSMNSTIPQEISPATPSCSASAPQQSISQKYREISQQLLQEAADSDEQEFEEDPLLQVLRKQRKWVKQQINEMDTLLKEFPEQHI